MKLPKIKNPFKKASGDEDDEYEDELEDEPAAEEDDDFDDDELDDEERGLQRRHLMVLGAGVLVLVSGIIGGAAWWFVSTGDEAPAATARGGDAGKGPRIELAMPAKPGTPNALTNQPAGGLNRLAGVRPEAASGSPAAPAAARPAAQPATAPPPAAGRPAGPNLARASGEIGGRFGGRADPLGGSLNAIGGQQEKGTGIVVPSVTSLTMRALPDHPGGRPLGPTPDARLVEKKEGQEELLPIVAKDGAQAWQVYARPYTPEHEDWPRVAIVIIELGLSRAPTMSAITKLPPQVTLALNPYAIDPKDWLVRMRLVGHEVMVMLPMESERFPVHDAGPHALDTGLKPEENIQRLEFILSRFAGYTGVVTSFGSRFGTSEKMMRPILETLKTRGLLFVATGEQRELAGPKIGEQIGLARVISDLTLDETPSREAIDAKLARLDEIIHDHQKAVAVAHSYPVTLARLIPWLKALQGRKIELVPVSALADTTQKAAE